MNLLLSLDENSRARAKKLEKQQPFQVRFDFHGVKINVYTNSSYIVNHLGLGYRYFQSNDTGNNDDTGNNNGAHLSLLSLEAGKPVYDKCIKALFPGRDVNDHILVSRNLDLIVFLRDLPLLAFYTVKLLFGMIIHPLHKRFLGLHAAALGKDGCGLILCGAARCGKTILTTLLIEQDYNYYSDDVTLLDRKSLNVLPFPRAINIREEYESLAAPLLKKARRVECFKIADQQRLLVDFTPPVIEEVEPAIICFPHYEAEKETRVQPVSPGKSLVGLMQQRFHPLIGSLEEYEVEDFEILGRLLDGVSCYRLVYSDQVEAARILENLVLEKIKAHENNTDK